MSLADANNMVMPVSPMGNGMYGNSMFGNGNDGAWWLLILLFALGGFNGNGIGNNGGNGVMPYLWNTQTQNDVNRGFDNAALSNQITAVQSSIDNGVISSMNQRFSDTLALTNNLNTINNSLQQCCCENRAAVADLKYTVATEACADRAAVNDGVQRVIDRIDFIESNRKDEKIADLERQLTAANLAASQIAQDTRIIDGVYNRLQTCPVSTMPIYGNQPIFTCNNGSCGGCAGGFNGNF